jgi:hypothetical protein
VSDEAVAAPKQRRARHTASVLLIILVAVLMPLVITAGWAITTITNTDRFVSTMSALGTNPTITNYAAAEGAATLVQESDLQARIEARLPKDAAFIAPLLTTQATDLLTKAFSHVLQSPQFQRVWTAKIRLVHESFVTAMTSNGSKLQSAAKLGLDVTPQLLAAIDQLDKQGIHALDPVRGYLTGKQPILVTIAQGKEFHQVQLYFHLATQLRWVLWATTLVLSIAAILIDSRRRRSGMWLGIAVACSCVVMLALLNAGRQYAMSHSSTPADVTNVLFSTLTSWLRWELRIVVIVGLVAALILWMAGPSRAARSLRRASAKGGSSATHAVLGDDTAGALETRGGSVLSWIAAHATPIAWAGVAVGGLVLAVWVDSLLWAGIVILVVLAWFLAIVRLRSRALAATDDGD